MSSFVNTDTQSALQKAQEDQLGNILAGQLSASEKALRDFFILIIAQLSSPQAVQDIIDFLENGDIEPALRRAAQAGSALAAKVNESYIAAGAATADHISDVLTVVIGFNQVNDRAVEALRENNLRFTQQLSLDVRAAIQATLIDQTTQGLNPRQQALAIRENIGLTAKQTQMVQNYRNNLETLSSRALTRDLRDRRSDSVVSRAIAQQRPLSDDQIESLVTRYRRRFIAYRAQVIARTETLRAVHRGSEDMFRQAIDDGTLSDNDLERTWITALDERVRGTHSTMHGQKRRMNEPFTSGAGARLRYPGDIQAPPSETIQCRCTVVTRMRSL